MLCRVLQSAWWCLLQVVARVAESLNKEKAKDPQILESAEMKDHLTALKRLFSALQALRPNEDVSRNVG